MFYPESGFSFLMQFNGQSDGGSRHAILTTPDQKTMDIWIRELKTRSKNPSSGRVTPTGRATPVSMGNYHETRSQPDKYRATSGFEPMPSKNRSQFYDDDDDYMESQKNSGSIARSKTSKSSKSVDDMISMMDQIYESFDVAPPLPPKGDKMPPIAPRRSQKRPQVSTSMIKTNNQLPTPDDDDINGDLNSWKPRADIDNVLDFY